MNRGIVGSRGRTILRWIRKALLWSLAALLVALVVGAIYQAIATEIDQREAFPGPGVMVDVGEHRLDEEGPYVLVGHSLAGLYSRIYAERYPEEVSGMVLVDSTHPDQFEGSSLALTMNRVVGIVGPLIARAGIARVFDLYPSHPELPPLQREQSNSLYYRTPHQVAMFEEMGTIPESMEKARRTGTLGEKPLVVVSAADHDAQTGALQEELTSLSSNSSQRVVEGSTHSSVVVDRDHAGQTSASILEVVEAVRSDQPLTQPSTPSDE